MLASLAEQVGREPRRKVPDFELDFRDWTDEELAELISRDATTGPAIRAASEARTREAWRSPAKWSLYISVISISIAIIAFVRTLGG